MHGDAAHFEHTAGAVVARAAQHALVRDDLGVSGWWMDCTFMAITSKPGQPRRLVAPSP